MFFASQGHAMTTTQRAQPSVASSHTWSILFLFYFGIWFFASVPASVAPWWAGDDYSFAQHFVARHNEEVGRPLANLVSSTLQWEIGPGGAEINVALRLLQGLLHVGAATGAAYILFRASRSRVALIAPALFLLWPYNGEAVLWRAAGQYPLAAFASVAGALLVSMALPARRWLTALAGSGLILAAVLVNQLGAAAGLVVWGCALVVMQSAPGRRDLAVAGWMVAAWGAGAIASAAIMRAALGSEPGRVQIATSVAAQFGYLVRLWSDFLLKPFALLQHTWQAVLLIAFGVLFVVHLVSGREPLSGRLIRLGALAAIFVLPFAPALVTTEAPTSMRVLYLAPFLLVTACIGIAVWAPQPVRDPRITVLMTALLLVLYLPKASANAGDFVNVYRADLATLQQIEATLTEDAQGAPPSLVVADRSTYFRSDDPHNVLTVLNGDGELSAFLVPWAGHYFIEGWSNLTPDTDAAHVKACSLACLDAASSQGTLGPFTLLALPESGDSCLCP